MVLSYGFRVSGLGFTTVDAVGAVCDRAAVSAEVEEFGFWFRFSFQ
jgi:hypothetical protein